tara:strand:- start:2350 stop:2595 length:246 start_codon:yes stop_codon:yes gene_type:complete
MPTFDRFAFVISGVALQRIMQNQTKIKSARRYFVADSTSFVPASAFKPGSGRDDAALLLLPQATENTHTNKTHKHANFRIE